MIKCEFVDNLYDEEDEDETKYVVGTMERLMAMQSDRCFTFCVDARSSCDVNAAHLPVTASHFPIGRQDGTDVSGSEFVLDEEFFDCDEDASEHAEPCQCSVRE